MSWQDEYQKKLVSAEEAVSCIKSGDKVLLGFFLAGTPPLLCEALARRKNELEGVKICENVGETHFGWHELGTEKAFEVIKGHFTDFDHRVLASGRGMEFVTFETVRTEDQMAEGEHWGNGAGPYNADVFMVRVSPPDKNGYCSFGTSVWMSKISAKHAKLVLAQVDPSLIRTYGENYIHVSEIDYFVQSEPSALFVDPTRPPGSTKRERREDEIAATEVIGELVANEIVRDGDTLEFGVGLVSTAMLAYLTNRHDLGIHSESIPGMVTEMVRNGIFTGKYKTINKGKVVATMFTMVNQKQLEFIENNPTFELYDVTYVNNLRTIMAHDNMVAINNAISVDVTGQICSESIGFRLTNGPGGQTDFTIGAQLSRGGRAVHVLPSTATVKGVKVSRIVVGFERGSVVTIPRNYADYIVTEYGIARLKSKTIRERIEEMISIAHPDFRAELRKEAAELYDVPYYRWRG